MDTSHSAMERQRELLREAGPQRRLEICLQLSQATRELALAGLRRQHAGASPAELRALLAERLYGKRVADTHFRRRRS